MTAIADYAVQAAVYAKLAGDENLCGLLAAGAAGIADHVATGLAMPYVAITDIASQSLAAQGSSGRSVTVTLRAYSQQPQGAEIRQIMAALHAAIDGAVLALDGYAALPCRAGDIATTRDAQNIRTGAMQVSVVTEQL